MEQKTTLSSYVGIYRNGTKLRYSHGYQVTGLFYVENLQFQC